MTEMKAIDKSEQADARRFRYWTAMIQNQPSAIKRFDDYSDADEIRKEIDEWMRTLTVCGGVLKAIHPDE